MARNRSLANLRADVRQRADIENSQHVSDAEINRYINQSIAALTAMLVEMDEDEWVTVSNPTVVTAGTPSTDLDDGGGPPVALAIYKILAVDGSIDNGVTTFPIRRFDWATRPRLDSSQGAEETRYRFVGDNTLAWAPPFQVDTQVRVTYIPNPVDLTADGDLFDGRAGWEEWVVYDAAIKCMIKEESDDSQLVRERAILEQRIRQQMTTRDRANPAKIRDVVRVDRW